MKIHKPFFAVAVLALGGSALAQEPSEGVPREATLTHLLAPADKVLGLDLEQADDEKLGKLGDLVLDPRTGEIRYAVVETGGFLGMGKDHKVVPWSFIQIVPDARDRDKLIARTTLTEEKLEAAPECKKDDIFTAEFDRLIETAFGKDKARSNPDDRVVDRAKGPATLVRWSHMEGTVVKDPSGKDVGSVKDLVLAPQDHFVAYAVLGTKREAGGKVVAMPLSRLMFTHDREKKNEVLATTPIEIARFDGAPEYDSKDWNRMSSTSWMTEMFAHYGAEPFWKTSHYASVRKPAKQDE